MVTLRVSDFESEEALRRELARHIGSIALSHDYPILGPLIRIYNLKATKIRGRSNAE